MKNPGELVAIAQQGEGHLGVVEADEGVQRGQGFLLALEADCVNYGNWGT